MAREALEQSTAIKLALLTRVSRDQQGVNVNRS